MTNNNKIIGFLKLLKTYIKNDYGINENVKMVILNDIEYYINYLDFKYNF